MKDIAICRTRRLLIGMAAAVTISRISITTSSSSSVTPRDRRKHTPCAVTASRWVFDVPRGASKSSALESGPGDSATAHGVCLLRGKAGG